MNYKPVTIRILPMSDIVICAPVFKISSLKQFFLISASKITDLILQIRAFKLDLPPWDHQFKLTNLTHYKRGQEFELNKKGGLLKTAFSAFCKPPSFSTKLLIR